MIIDMDATPGSDEARFDGCICSGPVLDDHCPLHGIRRKVPACQCKWFKDGTPYTANCPLHRGAEILKPKSKGEKK